MLINSSLGPNIEELSVNPDLNIQYGDDEVDDRRRVMVPATAFPKPPRGVPPVDPNMNQFRESDHKNYR